MVSVLVLVGTVVALVEARRREAPRAVLGAGLLSLLLFFGRRIGEPKAGYLASTMMALAFLVSVIMFFALHDLTHYAVETVLGFREGFYGLVAAGGELYRFVAESAEPVSREQAATAVVVFLIEPVAFAGPTPLIGRLSGESRIGFYEQIVPVAASCSSKATASAGASCRA